MRRMKENYESRSRTFLTRRTPVIMRIDGKTFSTWTRGLNKPFDEGLIEDMQKTAKYLCEQIQGAKCAYVQSDEISILITDYDKLETAAWFDYNVQKMTSIGASLATGIFNYLRVDRALNYEMFFNHNCGSTNYPDVRIDDVSFLDKNLPKIANFDCRVFNIPKEEVSNYFLARQKDAVKNSIAMLAQSLYSHTELEGKNGNEQQEMCFQKGHNWNDLHFSKKRGSFIVKNTYVNDKLAFAEKENYDLGDIWYQPNNAPTFDSCKSNQPGRLLEYDEIGDELNWVETKIEKIRSKWEVVETPFTFTEKDFATWLK